MGRCVTKAFVFTTTPLRGHIRPLPDTGEADYAPESRPSSRRVDTGVGGVLMIFEA